MTNSMVRRASAAGEHGFTLVELLVTMAITTVIVGATMATMHDAIKITDTAVQMTNLNNGLRTSMDVIVRDLLQVGQGLPSGNVVLLPSGNGAQTIRAPGPPTSEFFLTATGIGTAAQAAANMPVAISAVIPGPGLGPAVGGQPTDMITTIAADSAFEYVKLTALAANGTSMTVWNGPTAQHGANITDGGPDDLRAGDLIMLTRDSFSALVQVTSVADQTVNFAAGDSLNLNQQGAADGTVTELRLTPTADVLANPAPNPPVIATEATRIRMVSYYLDGTTNLQRPRLVRRINNGHETTFDNLLGTAVAFDIESLQITYDLANGVTNPANVRMVEADVAGTAGGRCFPDACSANQIRKVNVLLSGRSRAKMKNTDLYLRNRLLTQVSLRSLAFVDRYQ